MTTFNDLDEKQKAQLASLPYRVGLWISKSDETGGVEADRNEKRALHSIITGFTQDFLKSEFVEQLMLGTMALNDKWSSWEDDLDKVPEECSAAIEMLSDKLERKDILSLKITLMEVARNVAMAFRESSFHETFFGKLSLYFIMTFDSIRAVITHQQPKTMVELVNISRDESVALAQLSKVLRVGEVDGLPNTYVDVYADYEFEEDYDEGADAAAEDIKVIDAEPDAETETSAEVDKT